MNSWSGKHLTFLKKDKGMLVQVLQSKRNPLKLQIMPKFGCLKLWAFSINYLFSFFTLWKYSGPQKSWTLLPWISNGNKGHDFCDSQYIIFISSTSAITLYMTAKLPKLVGRIIFSPNFAAEKLLKWSQKKRLFTLFQRYKSFTLRNVIFAVWMNQDPATNRDTHMQ